MIRMQINKSVDTDIEFKGYKGRYFYFLAGGVLISIFTLFFLYSIHVPVIITFPIGIILALVTIFYTKNLQDKFGKWGHIQSKHKANFSISVNKKFKNIIRH